MKRRNLAGIFCAVSLAVSMNTTAFAGWEYTSEYSRYVDESAWQHDGTGWKFINPDTNIGIVGTWAFIDGNGDGIAERYYFYENGYLAVNTIIDTTYVNENGAAVVNGVVDTSAQDKKTTFETGWIYGSYEDTFVSGDPSAICAEVGWYSGDDTDYIRIYSESNYEKALFTGIMVPVEGSMYEYTVQDPETGDVLKISYNGLEHLDFTVIVPGTFSNRYLLKSSYGHYQKTEDLSHYVS
ncbi:MAG: hypothetical protein HFG49_16370 [Lachnospiraceae bacterium]|nr:hypothetical protein [Lachnospiraceae bacterium]